MTDDDFALLAARRAAPDFESKALAAIDLIRRTGAQGFQIRYQDDEDPVVWVAVATHRAAPGGQEVHTVGAGLDPTRAVMKLCEALIDGGECVHCHRPSMFDDDPEPTVLDEIACWYQWDPELATFRRGCE